MGRSRRHSRIYPAPIHSPPGVRSRCTSSGPNGSSRAKPHRSIRLPCVRTWSTDFSTRRTSSGRRRSTPDLAFGPLRGDGAGMEHSAAQAARGRPKCRWHHLRADRPARRKRVLQLYLEAQALLSDLHPSVGSSASMGLAVPDRGRATTTKARLWLPRTCGRREVWHIGRNSEPPVSHFGEGDRGCCRCRVARKSLRGCNLNSSAEKGRTRPAVCSASPLRGGPPRPGPPTSRPVSATLPPAEWSATFTAVALPSSIRGRRICRKAVRLFVTSTSPKLSLAFDHRQAGLDPPPISSLKGDL
jgi:hypothetical protein